MRNARLLFGPSDITPLVGLWSEYYGQQAVGQARRQLQAKRVGGKKTPCTEEELQRFFNGGPMSKTRRLEIFRAFMKRLGQLRALLAYRHRQGMRKMRQEAEAIAISVDKGEDWATTLNRWRR